VSYSIKLIIYFAPLRFSFDYLSYYIVQLLVYIGLQFFETDVMTKKDFLQKILHFVMS